MMEGLDKEVEAQVQREAGGNNNVDMDSDSELLQLRSSDLEGIESQAAVRLGGGLVNKINLGGGSGKKICGVV
jgi:hypothetical protein